MTAAGVGDLLVAGVSFADWYLAFRLGMDEGYTPLAETMMGSLGEELLELGPAVRRTDLGAMGSLARWIALAGLAMSLSHATTPLSGFEHVISHVLDMQANSTGRPLAMHGAQVALAARLSAGCYQRLLARFDPTTVNLERCFPGVDSMKATVVGAFMGIDPSGQVGEECWTDYRIKLDDWTVRRGGFRQVLAEWPETRNGLEARAVLPRRLSQITDAVGLPNSFQQLDPPVAEEQACFAFMNAPFIRRRGLFLTGVCFCYFILMPVALAASVQYAEWLGFSATQWRAEDYVGFVCKFMLGMGLGFDLPVVVLTLVKIGVLNYRLLASRPALCGRDQRSARGGPDDARDHYANLDGRPAVYALRDLRLDRLVLGAAGKEARGGAERR